MVRYGIRVLGIAAMAAGVASCMQGGGRQTAAAVPAPTVPNFGLFYMDEGQDAKLAYGEPNSDNVGLMFQCAKGSRVIEVTDAPHNSGEPSITLASSGRSQVLKARLESGEGAMLLVATTPYNVAPLSAFRRSGRLEVAQAGARYGVAASANERVGVERFFAACEGGKG